MGITLKATELVLVVVVMLATVACSNVPSSPAVASPKKVIHPVGKSVVKPVLKRQSLERRLRIAAKEWHGTPHRMGGLTKRGVDCSGLVMILYRDVMGIRLPRTTALQSKQGKKISRKNLRVGDLMFFKTGWGKRHSGIYVGNGEFVHTSSRRGVMISSIKDKYWMDSYWMTRRIQ